MSQLTPLSARVLKSERQEVTAATLVAVLGGVLMIFLVATFVTSPEMANPLEVAAVFGVEIVTLIVSAAIQKSSGPSVVARWLSRGDRLRKAQLECDRPGLMGAAMAFTFVPFLAAAAAAIAVVDIFVY